MLCNIWRDYIIYYAEYAYFFLVMLNFTLSIDCTLFDGMWPSNNIKIYIYIWKIEQNKKKRKPNTVESTVINPRAIRQNRANCHRHIIRLFAKTFCIFLHIIVSNQTCAEKIIIKLEFFDHLPGPITIYYCYGIYSVQIVWLTSRTSRKKGCPKNDPFCHVHNPLRYFRTLYIPIKIIKK